MARILLVGPTFFGYRDKIAQKLRSMGHEVDCFMDRPSESVTFRTAGRLSYRFVEPAIARHAGRLEQKVSSGFYDRLAYLSGMSFCFTRTQFEKIRSAVPATRFVAALWDAFENCQRFSACCDLFDDVYSFEPGDCKKYGLRLRPLFYLDEYGNIPFEPEDGFKYDACFIGSVHQPSKFEAIKDICDDLESQGMRLFRHFYMPSRSVEWFRKATIKSYRGIEFSHEQLSSECVARIYAQSRAIIDSPQAGQRGLTIRTLEAIGARRKLITVNPEVERYDFANYGGVAVWRGVGSVGRSFFKCPYREIPEEIYRSYSIESFASALAGEVPTYSGYKKGRVVL